MSSRVHHPSQHGAITMRLRQCRGLPAPASFSSQTYLFNFLLVSLSVFFSPLKTSLVVFCKVMGGRFAHYIERIKMPLGGKRQVRLSFHHRVKYLIICSPMNSLYVQVMPKQWVYNHYFLLYVSALKDKLSFFFFFFTSLSCTLSSKLSLLAGLNSCYSAIMTP